VQTHLHIFHFISSHPKSLHTRRNHQQPLRPRIRQTTDRNVSYTTMQHVFYVIRGQMPATCIIHTRVKRISVEIICDCYNGREKLHFTLNNSRGSSLLVNAAKLLNLGWSATKLTCSKMWKCKQQLGHTHFAKGAADLINFRIFCLNLSYRTWNIIYTCKQHPT